MSVELLVFLEDAVLPDYDGWQRAIDEAGFDVHLDAFSPRAHTGYLPAMIGNHECGFEYSYHAAELNEENEEEADEELIREVGTRSHCAIFKWHVRELDGRVACLAAAVLARLSNGVLFDPQSGDFAPGAEAFDLIESWGHPW